MKKPRFIERWLFNRKMAALRKQIVKRHPDLSSTEMEIAEARRKHRPVKHLSAKLRGQVLVALGSDR